MEEREREREIVRLIGKGGRGDYNIGKGAKRIEWNGKKRTQFEDFFYMSLNDLYTNDVNTDKWWCIKYQWYW